MQQVTIDPGTWREGRAYRKNRLLTAAALRQAGAFLQVVVIPPGNHIPPHAHRTAVEVYVVRRGVCELVVNGETVIMRPDDIILMEPGDVHALTNHGDELFELLVFKTNAAEDDVVWTDEAAP